MSTKKTRKPRTTRKKAVEANDDHLWGRGGTPLWFGGRSVAKIEVNNETALTYSAVWAATRCLCEPIGFLPLVLYRRLPDGGRIPATDHRLYPVLHMAPNPRMGTVAFRESRAEQQINAGNGFAEIERNALGEVEALWPIHTTRVSCSREPGYDYAVSNRAGMPPTHFRADDMLHIAGAMSPDGLWGRGVIACARESIGTGIATEQHGAAYFGSGAQPKGVLFVPGLDSNSEKRKQFRREWKEIHDSPDQNEVAILPPGGEYKPITISNNDSQFLETRQHNVTEIARWYRVPPHMLSDLSRATFSNIEHLATEFVKFSLMPWLARWEDELNRKLLTTQEQDDLFIAFNINGLLRGDFASRMTGFVQGIGNGIYTLNEARRLEDMPSIGAAGDENYVPLNLTTAERMGAGQEDQSRSKELARALVTDFAERWLSHYGKAAQAMLGKRDMDEWRAENHRSRVNACWSSIVRVADAVGCGPATVVDRLAMITNRIDESRLSHCVDVYAKAMVECLFSN